MVVLLLSALKIKEVIALESRPGFFWTTLYITVSYHWPTDCSTCEIYYKHCNVSINRLVA